MLKKENLNDRLVSNTVELVESSEKKPSYGENLVTVTDLENQDEKYVIFDEIYLSFNWVSAICELHYYMYFLRCIKKIMMVEKIEYETEIECDHRNSIDQISQKWIYAHICNFVVGIDRSMGFIVMRKCVTRVW